MEIYNNSLMKSCAGSSIPENPFENIQLGHTKALWEEHPSTVVLSQGPVLI